MAEPHKRHGIQTGVGTGVTNTGIMCAGNDSLCAVIEFYNHSSLLVLITNSP